MTIEVSTCTKKKTRCAEMSRWRSSPRGFVTVPLLLHYEKCIELEALFLLFSLSFILSCVFFFPGEEDGRGNKSRRKEERNNSWHQHSGRRKPIAPNSSNQVLQRNFSLLLNFCIHCISASLPPAKSSHSIQQFPLILKNNHSCFNHTTIRNARRWKTARREELYGHTVVV